MTAQMTFEYEFATPALDAKTAEQCIALDFYERANALDEDPATFDEAAALYQRAIDTDPQFAIAYTNLGNIHFRQGNEQRAVELYEQALSIDDRQPEAHYNLGYVRLERGLAPAAVSHFERAIENDPHFDTAHFNLAMALERAGNPARAQRHWQQYLEIEPTGTLANVARLHQFVWADSGRLGLAALHGGAGTWQILCQPAVRRFLLDLTQSGGWFKGTRLSETHHPKGFVVGGEEAADTLLRAVGLGWLEISPADVVEGWAHCESVVFASYRETPLLRELLGLAPRPPEWKPGKPGTTKSQRRSGEPKLDPHGAVRFIYGDNYESRMRELFSGEA